MEQQEPATNPESVESTPVEEPAAAAPPDQPSASAPEPDETAPPDQPSASAPEPDEAAPPDQIAESTPAVDPVLPTESVSSVAQLPTGTPQMREAQIVQAIARSVREVSGVADIYAGQSIVPAAIKRSRNVPGVQVLTEAGRLKVEVQLVATYTPNLSLPAVAAAVRRTIRQQLTTVEVNTLDAIDVVFADIVDPTPTAKEAQA